MTPSDARSSALPRPVRLRLPCLATRTGWGESGGAAAAVTMAASVEMLKVLGAPPVPQVSSTTPDKESVSGMGVTWARIAKAPATSSSQVTPRVCMRARAAAIWA